MNTAATLNLSIDTHSPIPINVQLKEQLLCLIATGIVKPGDYLPSANELAENVSVNRNTVNAIYHQLADEGFVSIRKGSGTQVLDCKHITEARSLFTFIWDKIKQADEQQLPLRELSVAHIAFSQIYAAVAEPSKRVLFVSFRPDDFAAYIDEISSIRTSSIIPVSFEQLSRLDMPELAQLASETDIVVTPYSGLKDIHKLEPLSAKRIVAVGDIPY